MRDRLRERIEVAVIQLMKETDSTRMLQHLTDLEEATADYKAFISRGNPPPSQFEWEAAHFYKPTEVDIRWAVNTLAMLKDDGVMAFPDAGLIYKVDHHQHAVVLQNTEQLLEFQSFATHLQTIAVFKQLGYRVTENYKGKKTQ